MDEGKLFDDSSKLKGRNIFRCQNRQRYYLLKILFVDRRRQSIDDRRQLIDRSSIDRRRASDRSSAASKDDAASSERKSGPETLAKASRDWGEDGGSCRRSEDTKYASARGREASAITVEV